MAKVTTDAEALKPILENSADSQLSEADRLDQQTAIALDEVDKLATTSVSSANTGLDGAFARGGTEINPDNVRTTERGRKRQIEHLVQDTTTRIDKVLKRSADSYLGNLPSAGTGNLERMLWANRGDAVKNKITAAATGAADSALLADGYNNFYAEAKMRAEQELQDQFDKYNNFQEKYGESSWFGRRFSRNKRDARRFENFQAPMQEALSTRLDEIQSRIDAMKDGPQAEKVKRMAENIDRRFKHSSAGKKILLWDQIQAATLHSGTLNAVALSEFGIIHADVEQKALFVEALISGDLPWVKERLGIKEDSDQKHADQTAVIASARNQEALVSGNLSLPSTDSLKTILTNTFLKDKEPLNSAVSSEDLVTSLENNFRSNTNTKDLIDGWFPTGLGKYDLLTSATKLHIFIKELQGSNWNLSEHLSLDTQQKLITWLHQIEEARGGKVESYEAGKVELARNALNRVKGDVSGAIPRVTKRASVLGKVSQKLHDIEVFDLSSGFPDLSALETLVVETERDYKRYFIDTCADEIDEDDYKLLESLWSKARTAAKTMLNKHSQWQEDRLKWLKWEDAHNTSSVGTSAYRVNESINRLEATGLGSIVEAEQDLADFDPTTLVMPGGVPATPAMIKSEQQKLLTILSERKKQSSELKKEQSELQKTPKPQITGIEEIRQLLNEISNLGLQKHENKLKKEKSPTPKGFEDQLLETLRTEFADQIEQTFLSKLATNDQFDNLQKLGRGGRVSISYKKVGATGQMRFPDQLSNITPITFKVNRVVDGKVELVQEPPAGASLAIRETIVITGPAFKEGDDHITARAGVSTQSWVAGAAGAAGNYGPSVNPEAAIITNMNVL